ncbi:MAG: hypothetical protein ACREB2_01080 [Pseudolabrys sp.]
MRKSVIGIVGVAALAASSFAIDNAAARDHGGGVNASSGSRGMASSFSHSSGVPSVGGRSMARVGGSPSFQSNRNISSFSGGRRFSSGRRDFGRDGRHHHHGRNFAFGVVPFGFYDGYYNDYAYDYGDDCYQVRRVRTPYGWRWRRIDVCGASYY